MHACPVTRPPPPCLFAVLTASQHILSDRCSVTILRTSGEVLANRPSIAASVLPCCGRECGGWFTPMGFFEKQRQEWDPGPETSLWYSHRFIAFLFPGTE